MSGNSINTASLSIEWVQNAKDREFYKSGFEPKSTSVEQKNAGNGSNTVNRGQDLPQVKVAKDLVKPDKATKGGIEQSNLRSSLDDAMEQINKYIQKIQKDILFTVDEESGRDIVKIMDTNTKEVIRQLPSEVAIHLAQNLQKNGSLVSFKV